MKRQSWLWAWTLLPALVAAAPAPTGHPLLDLAAELGTPELRVPAEYGGPEIRHAEHALRQADVPPDEECAGSLGAFTFADLHGEVGRAHEAKGDFLKASAAYRRAIACSPRDARYLGGLADALFDARDFPGARAAIEQALAISPRSVYLIRIAGNLDFVEERWADAVSRFRYVAASEPDRARAAYAQLMYWLAQRRAGMPQPEFVARRRPEGWPLQLMGYLEGDYTEAELVQPIREGTDETANVSSPERLCEALYYVGEAHWARGDPDLARRYFAAAVNLKIIYFIEHGLAVAEIAKLRER